MNKEGRIEANKAGVNVEEEYFDLDRGIGHIKVEVNGKIHVLKIYKNREGRGYIVEYAGNCDSLSNIKKMLTGTELEPHINLLEQRVRTLIYRQRIYGRSRKRILATRTVVTEAGELKICLRNDGRFLLTWGSRRVVADKDNLVEKLYEVLPLEVLDRQLADSIATALRDVADSIIPASGFIVVIDDEVNETVLPSIVVDDKLVFFLPFTGRYVSGNDMRTGLLVLVIVADSKGNIERMYIERVNRGHVKVKVGTKIISKSFLDAGDCSDSLKHFLPSTHLIKLLMNMLKSSTTITWGETLKLIEGLLSKYVCLDSVNKEKAALYCISQVFYDLLPTFPILRIIGEKGSGKRQLAMVIASCSPLALTIVNPSEASIYRLTNALHPLLVIDESRISRDHTLLLNAGFEKDKFVPRSRVTTENKIVIDMFNVFSPKVLVTRPGKMRLPDDTLSRIIEVTLQRVTNRVFPQEIEQNDKLVVVTTLLMLKIRKWREFLDAYQVLRSKLVGIDPRARDTYLPLITIAYLVSREVGNPGLFKRILEDLLNTIEEKAGVDYHQKLAIVGVLKCTLRYSSLSNNKVFVEVTVKDIVEALGLRLGDPIKSRIGLFLKEAPFKVSSRKSGGYTKYIIDITKLYQFIDSYKVDISGLSDEEIGALEKFTGLLWKNAGFNKDAWINELMKDLGLEVRGKTTPQVLQQPSTPSTESATTSNE